MSNSISEIVSLSDSPENNLIAELSGGESAFLDKHCNMLIPQRYALHISSTAVKDIEEKVKNAILEWTLKLEEEGIVGENMMFTEKEKDCATNIPQTVNNYYGPTSVINSSSGNAQIVSGNGNTVSFTYDKVKDIVDEVEKSINASNLSKYDTETVIELLSDIKSKIKEEKSPAILKAALIGLKDFLINVGASVAAGIIQAKIQGLFQITIKLSEKGRISPFHTLTPYTNGGRSRTDKVYLPSNESNKSMNFVNSSAVFRKYFLWGC